MQDQIFKALKSPEKDPMANVFRHSVPACIFPKFLILNLSISSSIRCPHFPWSAQCNDMMAAAAAKKRIRKFSRRKVMEQKFPLWSKLGERRATLLFAKFP